MLALYFIKHYDYGITIVCKKSIKADISNEHNYMLYVYDINLKLINIRHVRPCYENYHPPSDIWGPDIWECNIVRCDKMIGIECGTKRNMYRIQYFKSNNKEFKIKNLLAMKEANNNNIIYNNKRIICYNKDITLIILLLREYMYSNILPELYNVILNHIYNVSYISSIELK